MDRNMKAEVLAVDDHSLILEGICKVVNRMPEAVVANYATTGEEALKFINARDYDVYILDVNLPDMSGFDLIKRIRELNAQARIIINTMHEEIWIVTRLLKAGVNAILLKASATNELVHAVRAVLQGGSYACPRFTAIQKKLSCASAALVAKDVPTPRELDVLKAIAKGLNTREIDEQLGISENTVETFRKRLITKFCAKNAVDLVLKGVEAGWITLE